MKKVSLKDIAGHLNISTALVSYVLNGQAVEKKVNEKTAEKILQTAKLFNYRPDQIAKSLKTQKTHTIGLIVADINYQFSSGITSAIEEETKKYKYTVIYGSSNENKERFAELINVFINRRVDGLIIIPVADCEDQIELLRRYEIPFVLVDRVFPSIKTSNITLDNYKTAWKAAQYLIDLGHRRIGLVTYRTSLFHLHERERGFKDCLKKNKIRFRPEWLYEIENAPNHLREENVQSAIDKILTAKPAYDAVFFGTNTLTGIALKYLIDLDVKVPDQLSIMSFDESDSFKLFYCPITHSRQPLREMGKTAVVTLMELMNNPKLKKQLSFNAELIAGRSCGEQKPAKL